MVDAEGESGGQLAGRRALVIGAGTPAGRVAAVSLAAAGADVAVASGSIDGDEVMAVRRARRAIEALGRRTAEYAMDLSLGANVRVSTRQVAKELGGLNILVNAADAYLRKSTEAISDAEWARSLSVNLNGVYYACRSAVKEMSEGGVIINLCPWITGGGSGLGMSGAYLAAKHGVVGLTYALAEEYAPRGIRVVAVLVEVSANLGDVPPFAPLPVDGDLDALGRLITQIVLEGSDVVVRFGPAGERRVTS